MTRLQIQKMTEATKRQTKAHNEMIKALDAFEKAKEEQHRTFTTLTERFNKHGLVRFF